MGLQRKHFMDQHTEDCGLAWFIWVEGFPCVPDAPSLSIPLRKSLTVSSARSFLLMLKDLMVYTALENVAFVLKASVQS